MCFNSGMYNHRKEECPSGHADSVSEIEKEQGKELGIDVEGVMKDHGKDVGK